MTSSITVPRKKQIDLLIKEDTILLYFISLNLEVIVAHVILVDIDPRLSVEDLRALVVLFEQQALIAFCLKIQVSERSHSLHILPEPDPRRRSCR